MKFPGSSGVLEALRNNGIISGTPMTFTPDGFSKVEEEEKLLVVHAKVRSKLVWGRIPMWTL